MVAPPPSSSRIRACHLSQDRFVKPSKSSPANCLSKNSNQQLRSSRLPSSKPLLTSELTRRLSLALTYRTRVTSSLSLSSRLASRAPCSASTSLSRSGTSSLMPRTSMGSASRKLFSQAAKTLTQELESMQEALNHMMPLLLFSTQLSRSITSMTYPEDTSATWITPSSSALLSLLRTPP